MRRLQDVALNERITLACRECVQEFVRDRTGKDGRIGENWGAKLMKFSGFYQEPWVRTIDTCWCCLWRVQWVSSGCRPVLPC